MTKSPVKVARLALATAKGALSDYSCPKSRHDFTQAQIFSILVLKAFFRMDYRGITALLEDLPELRRELGLKKAPHFSTLFHAQKRLLKKGLLTYCSEPYLSEQEGAFELRPRTNRLQS